jgi:hypothetical protein
MSAERDARMARLTEIRRLDEQALGKWLAEPSG